MAAGDHEIQPPVAIQIASVDRGGRGSDNGVEAIEGELAGSGGGWGGEGEVGGVEGCESGGGAGVASTALQL